VTKETSCEYNAHFYRSKCQSWLLLCTFFVAYEKVNLYECSTATNWPNSWNTTKKYQILSRTWLLTETRRVAGDVITKRYSVHLKHPTSNTVYFFIHIKFLYFPDKIFAQCQWRSLHDEEYFSTNQNFEIHDELRGQPRQPQHPQYFGDLVYASRNSSQILHGDQNWKRRKFTSNADARSVCGS